MLSRVKLLRWRWQCLGRWARQIFATGNLPVKGRASCGRLSAYAAFSLSIVAERAPKQAPPLATVSQLLSERCASGELFVALLPVAGSGAVLETRIVASDAGKTEYRLTVLPTAF